MAQLFSTSRDEAATFRFPALFYPLVIVLSLVLQAYLPVLLHTAVYLDLPLLVIVYWATSRRNSVSASLLGAGLGLAQDSLANLVLGVNGIAKTLIGYFGATLGGKLIADNAVIRFLAVLAAYEFNRAMLYIFERFLLGTPVPWRGEVTLMAAVVNGLLAIMVFRGLDRFRLWA